MTQQIEITDAPTTELLCGNCTSLMVKFESICAYCGTENNIENTNEMTLVEFAERN